MSEVVEDLPSSDVTPMSPKTERIRHHLIPARTSTCVRAPCLKRQVLPPVSVLTLPSVVSHPQDALPAIAYASPRHESAGDSESRHVRFDQAPPQEFFVLSGEKYDRTSIKCTKGGSAFDMSLPPRYSDDDADDQSQTHESVSGVVDAAQECWASIKNGAVELSSDASSSQKPQSGLMASGKSLHFSALSSLQHASALAGSETPPLERKTSEQISLPVHGFRSFGRLGGLNSLGIESGLCTPPHQHEEELKTSASTLFSPDATPMPSPSVHKALSWRHSDEYFDISTDNVRSQIPSETTVQIIAVDESQCDTPRLDAETISSAPPTPLANIAETLTGTHPPDSNQQASTPSLPLPTLLGTGPVGVSWSSMLGMVASPLSSRCSSVDPWSSLSSDGDFTDSPGHEAQWSSSSCTSPDLAPSEQNAEGFTTGARRDCSPSLPVKIGHVKGELPADPEHNMPSGLDANEDAKFSSSVETIHTSATDRRALSSSPSSYHQTLSDCSTPEGSKPESVRRPSLRHFESRSRREAQASLDGTDDDSIITRSSLSSRDGHVKKKSSKCKACRLLRQRFKGIALDSPSLSISSPGTDAEKDTSPFGTPPMQISSSSSDHEAAEPAEMIDLASSQRPRTPARSLSMCDGGSLSSSSSRSRSTDRSMSFDSFNRSASPRVRQDSVQESTYSPADSSSESPLHNNLALPLACTCDLKRDKERLKKKIRKERDLERERDREWEQNEARGRQQRLFGESDPDGSCLDGF